MNSKQSYKNEIRILCEKIKYLGELIDDLMEDTEDEIQKMYLQGEIEKYRLELLKIEVQEQYQVIENDSTKNIWSPQANGERGYEKDEDQFYWWT